MEFPRQCQNLNQWPQQVGRHDEPVYTLQEIFQQPLLWPATVARVRAASGQLNLTLREGSCIVDRRREIGVCRGRGGFGMATGRAVPTTDLLVDAEQYLTGSMP